MIPVFSFFRRFMGPIAVAGILLACPTELIAQATLMSARDLVADAKYAENVGLPLIVLVSLPGCPHCELVRRTHLLPLLRNGRDGPTTQKPLIRQIDINGRDILRDFSGDTTTHAEFARRYKISIAPVVMFFDAQGALATEPLVGSMIPDFYGAYFDAALTEAKLKLQRARPTRP